MLLAMVSVLPARTASAESAEVEQLIREAVELRKQKRDADAFPLLQKAHAIGRTARTAAQLGLVEYNLGYWLDAEEHLSASLAAKLDPWVYQNRPVLEQSLSKARAAIGEVVVTGTPAGAEVMVNGRKVGVLPLAAPVRVVYGPAELEVRASGHRPDRRAVIVVGRQRHEVAVTLEPEPVALSAARSAPPVPGQVPPIDPGTQLATTSPLALTASESSEKASWLRPAAWASATAAAVALSVGIYGTTRWHAKADDFDSHKSPTSGLRDCGIDDAGRGGPGCAGLYSDMRRARATAIAGYVAGGVLGAGSAAMFILSASRSNRSTASCLPSVALVGGGCIFTF
jgi:PEGA domain